MSTHSWQAGPSESYKYYDGPFHRPVQDDRQYRLLQLTSGLEAVLVNDLKADKSAACLTVAAGYLQDPVSARKTPHETLTLLTRIRMTCRGWLISASTCSPKYT